jgi:hypothetical protein
LEIVTEFKVHYVNGAGKITMLQIKADIVGNRKASGEQDRVFAETSGHSTICVYYL